MNNSLAYNGLQSNKDAYITHLITNKILEQNPPQKPIGIPEWFILYVNEITKYNKSYQLQIYSSINLTIDLNNVKYLILINIVEQSLLYFNHYEYIDIFNSINNILQLLRSNNTNRKKWLNAAAIAAVAANAASAAAYELFVDKLIELTQELQTE